MTRSPRTRPRRRRTLPGDRRRPQQEPASRQCSWGELVDEERTHLGGVDIGRDESLADAADEKERHPPAPHLLVLRHQIHELVDARYAAGYLRNVGRQADLAEVALDPFGVRRRREPARGGKIEGERHAERDRLAMQQPVGKSRRRLEGVPERVAEIEQRTVAGLALVARDYVGLHATARGDRVLARRGAAGEEVV